MNGGGVIDVDKNSLLAGERELTHQTQAAPKHRKNSCVRCRILQEWDCQITALTELQFQEGPLRRVFFFRSSDFLEMVTQGRARIGMALAESA